VQAAVDAAREGDVIKIAAGTYSDLHQRQGSFQVVHIKKRITLRGGYSAAGGYADPHRPDTHRTILDAQSQGRVVVIDHAGPTLEGLVITGGAGYSSGGGIHAEGSSAIIRYCQIVDNAADGDGGGVFVNRGSVLIEIHHEWQVARRYFSKASMRRLQEPQEAVAVMLPTPLERNHADAVSACFLHA